MKRTFLIPASSLWLLASGLAPAIVDTNTNGLSDLWEQHHNSGDLLPATFDPEADDDQDGWTNAEEAAAGTNPFDPNPPTGILRPDLIHTPAVWGDPDNDGNPDIITPEAITISWTTLPGKHYRILISTSLASGSWLPVDDPFIGTGTQVNYHFLTSLGADQFFRVSVSDTDTDGDTLSDYEEYQLSSNPISSDSDGDGLSDVSEARMGSDPTKPDTDGDTLFDGEDAHPADALIDWRKTPEAVFMLVDVTVPSDQVARDVNDKGEVLFGGGVWKDGEWTAMQPESLSSAYPLQAGIQTYDIHFNDWHRFNSNGQLIGNSEIEFTSGEAAGGDRVHSAFASLALGSSIHPGEGFVPNSISILPMGIDYTGRTFLENNYVEIVNGEPVTKSRILVRPPNSANSVVLRPTNGFYPQVGVDSTTVSRSGRIAVNTVSSKTFEAGQAHQLVFWNSELEQVHLPQGTNYKFNPLHISDLNHGKPVICGHSIVTGSNVFLQNDDGVILKSDRLSGHGIQLFSGNGTALTSDHKIWRNGILTPLNEVCQRYEELRNNDWEFHPLSANHHGVFLVAAKKQGLETEYKLLVPLTFDFVSPDSVDWSAVYGSKEVFLKNENIRVKAMLSGVEFSKWHLIKNLGLDAINLATPSFSPALVSLEGPSPYLSLHKLNFRTEIRCELNPIQAKNFHLIQDENIDDSIEEWSSVDVVSESGDSTFDDSDAFMLECKQETLNQRGAATDIREINILGNPLEARATKSFMKSGGAMRIRAAIPAIELEANGLVQNQADIFYYSGHGTSLGTDGHGFFSNTPDVTSLGELNNHWNGDLDLIIISGCALCNINNHVANPLYYPPPSGPHAGYYPGVDLEATIGAKFAVGYGSSGPSDKSGTKIIIKEFMRNRHHGIFLAWRNANSANRSWNATAIEKGVKMGYFNKSSVLGIDIHEWTEISKENW